MKGMSLRSRLEPILPLVERPTRYLGNELNLIRKSPGEAAVQWLLVMPEVYEIGMSHQGLKILYDILNRRPDALAERAYAPWLDMEDKMREAGIPLFALESHRPARDFDVIGFSLQYELTCTNIVNLIDLAGIPVWQKDRADGDPLIVAGGPVASNPESTADFFDGILIGDGEEAVHEMTDVIARTKGTPRRERLAALAEVEGVYVPSLYRPEYDGSGRLVATRPVDAATPLRVKRRFLADLEDAPYPEVPIVPVQEIVQDRLTVELLRGCTQGCRFCQAGYYYRPLRERSVAKVSEMTMKGIKATGWDEVSLVSLSTADHTQIETITDVISTRLSPENVGISFSSLRADRFSVALAERVSQVRKSGFTFAPEAGSERLRFHINKLITDDELFKAVRAAFEKGWRLIKLYFMVGLPTETDDDVGGIVDMVRKIHEIGREYGGGITIHASVGSFVPKSHTPYQWEPFEDPASLKRKIGFLREKVNTRWTRLKYHSVDSSHVEAVLSLGDRRVAQAVYNVWKDGGRFDGWTEHFSIERWEKAFREAGIDPAVYTGPKGIDEALPWDHIDTHILKKFLKRERDRSSKDVTVKDCRYGDCIACGVPGLPNDTRLSEPPTAGEVEALKAGEDRPAHVDLPLYQIGKGALGSPTEPPIDPDPRREPADRSADPVQKLRLAYAKLGDARFIGNLDLRKVLGRAFKVAEIPVAYSRGFNPRPRIVVGAPLSVGIESLCEPADVDLVARIEPEEILGANRYLPRGLEIVDVREIPVAGTRLSDRLDTAVYLVDAAPLAAAPGRDPDWLRGRLEAFRASPAWETRKRHKKGIRTIDLKEAVLRLEIAAPERGEILRARWVPHGGPYLALDVRLQDEDGNVANPYLVLGDVLELGAEELARLRVVRLSFSGAAFAQENQVLLNA